MSRTITVAVDLDQDDAALKIEEGITTLRQLQETTMPMYNPDGSRVGPGAPFVKKGHEHKNVEGDTTKKTEAPAATVEKTEAPAATAETSTAPPPPEGVDVDSEGLPWDGRIHSSAKTKLVKGGTWKIKRGTDPALIEKVKAELKATMAAPAVETPAAPEGGETEDANPKEVFGGPVTDTPAPPPLPDTPMSFPDLMEIITARQAAGTLQKTDLDALLLGYEIPSVGMLASRPDLIPTIAEELEAL